jgi:hypothetical protein
MNDLIQLLRQLEAARFYGSLEVKFEAGNVTVIKKTESIKPGAGDHRNNRGHANEHPNPE